VIARDCAAAQGVHSFLRTNFEVKTVAASSFRRFGIALCAALVATALTVPIASAKSAKSSGLGDLLGLIVNANCNSSGSQVFAQWNDFASYFLAPNGGLESGSLGWSLSGGASVVNGNEPFYATGSHSLSLPSGSTATSGTTCIGKGDLYVRMFGADQGGTDHGLQVHVVWYGLLNKVLGITDFNTYAPGSAWSPTDKLSSSGGSIAIPLLPILGSTSARVQLTPIGSGSRWLIDDLYIDPSCIRG
jgi:hypothetical protein